MGVKTFYDNNNTESWKVVLGEDLHYHIGSKSDGDIFKQAIFDLYQHIPDGSSVLDCGCGWGAPARMLMNDKNCKITGVTISDKQAEYITDFPVINTDLQKYTPDTNYDVALFVESFCHLRDPFTVLKNIKNNVNKIVIRDYIWPTVWYNNVWKMMFYPKNFWVKILSESGFSVDLIEEDKNATIFATCEYWYNNIQKLNREEVVGHIQNLETLCITVLNHTKNGTLSETVPLIHIVATAV